MAVVGTTGSGKSTLLARLLLSHPDTVVLQTKADDVAWPGRTVRHAADIEDARWARFIVKPDYDAQTKEILDLFERTWKHRGWLVAIDELAYLQEVLGIKTPMTRLLTQGRSLGLTCVMGMQRPVGVTRYALSQASHLIAFHQDGRDAKTIADSAGLPRTVEQRLRLLRQHEFLWYSVPARKFWVGYLQDLERKAATAT